jgi:hypothetical protein
MKLVKIVAVLFAAYVAMVMVFEVVIGYVQPGMDIGIVLTTTDSQGKTFDRMLAGVRMDDRLYVSANHWPRSWYNRALANPAVEVTVDGKRSPYTAIPLAGPELDRIAEKYRFGFVFRFITGFAPRRFLRLDPR